MRLDHVSYAAGPDGLASTVQRIGADLGASFSDGGIHPQFGTRNFVLPLSGGTYVEVVGVLDHPAADSAPFGRAVKARGEQGGGWLAWVVATDDLGTVAARLGRRPQPGHRHLPDGTELRWEQIGVLDVIADPQLPFFIRWDPDVRHPSAPGGPVREAVLEISGDPERVHGWLGDLGVEPPDVEIDWVDAELPGLVGVQFDTPRGRVRVD